MTETVTIFVRLLDERVDVWRPVAARHLSGRSYRIVDESYDRTVETWEFEPRQDVICEEAEDKDGVFLRAVRAAT